MVLTLFTNIDLRLTFKCSYFPVTEMSDGSQMSDTDEMALAFTASDISKIEKKCEDLEGQNFELLQQNSLLLHSLHNLSVMAIPLRTRVWRTDLVSAQVFKRIMEYPDINHIMTTSAKMTVYDISVHLEPVLLLWSHAVTHHQMFPTFHRTTIPASKGRSMFSFKNYCSCFPQGSQAPDGDRLQSYLNGFSKTIKHHQHEMTFLRTPGGGQDTLLRGYICAAITLYCYHLSLENPVRYALEVSTVVDYDDNDLYREAVGSNTEDLWVEDDHHGHNQSAEQEDF